MRGPRRPASIVVLMLLCALGFSSLWIAGCKPRPEPTPEPQPDPVPQNIVDLEVGLTEDERNAWRYLTEGSDLVPVAVLRALKDIHTGKPYSESLGHYGFLANDPGPGNPYGLAVGWTVDVPSYSLLKLDYVGVNCSACHTGQIEFDGAVMRIDGAPNMADIEAFGLSVEESVLHMVTHPGEALKFVWRLVTLEPVEKDEGRPFADVLSEQSVETLEAYAEALLNDVDEAEDEEGRELGAAFARILKGETEPDHEEEESTGLLDKLKEGKNVLRQLLDFVDKYEALLKNRLELGTRAIHAFKISPVPGPGRDDPWGIIRNLLFYDTTPLTAPTSIPHLYYSHQYGWYHADGNTNSVMQRNVAQAVALGAYVDGDTGVSTLRPRHVWALEALMGKLESPVWPDAFPALDADKVKAGEEIFHRKMEAPSGAMVACSDCHRSWDGTLFRLEEVGTDPNRVKNFLRPEGDRPFYVAIPEAVTKIEKLVFDVADITRDDAKKHEYVENP